jgi:uncharacterized protein YjbJ (UPF0337 family)
MHDEPKTDSRRSSMNPETLKGKWKEIKGEIKVKWGKLTDDDIAQVEGREEQLLGLIQKKYGYSKDQAEEEYDKFIARFERPSGPSKKHV